MSKWLADVSPTDPAVAVAAGAIRVRLDCVRLYLKRSVKKPGQPENIHQLRVWSRRSESALELYADMLPRKQLRWLRRKLKRLRRAAGRVRDCDVYAERAAKANGEWPVSLRSERLKAQRRLERLFKKFDRGRRLKKVAKRLIENLETRYAGATETYRERAQRTLRPLLAAFFVATPDAADDEAALHRFRIAVKEVRYALELLAGAFPPELRDELYPVLSALQSKLGLINDLAVAQGRLRSRLLRSSDPGQAGQLQRQLAEAGAELARARRDFRDWWTPAAAARYQARFAVYVTPPTANT